MLMIIGFLLVRRLLRRRLGADHHADPDLPADRGQELGFDPVHFGLFFIMAITIGNFTPPVGSAMYVVCTILDCPIGDYTKQALPFLAACAVVLLPWLFALFSP